MQHQTLTDDQLRAHLNELDRTIDSISRRKRPGHNALKALSHARQYHKEINAILTRRFYKVAPASHQPNSAASSNSRKEAENADFEDFIRALKSYRPGYRIQTANMSNRQRQELRDAILDLAIDLFDFAEDIGLSEKEILAQLEI